MKTIEILNMHFFFLVRIDQLQTPLYKIESDQPHMKVLKLVVLDQNFLLVNVNAHLDNNIPIAICIMQHRHRGMPSF
jgi:hypothetical protein